MPVWLGGPGGVPDWGKVGLGPIALRLSLGLDRRLRKLLLPCPLLREASVLPPFVPSSYHHCWVFGVTGITLVLLTANFSEVFDASMSGLNV
mmetsp:Transcript_9495/g.14641  ORF Transcript_9495/g.14641 Transcript_9495/m.14641 type:complete len:92 (-) Transcript_9495:151-426(-)